jgi:hypothetical protein
MKGCIKKAFTTILKKLRFHKKRNWYSIKKIQIILLLIYLNEPKC